MSVLAPAIVDVRSPATDRAARITNWLRGIGVRQVRLACGLVMFSYIFSHFFNHALGNVSYALMETWLTFHIWWWRIPIVNATLRVVSPRADMPMLPASAVTERISPVRCAKSTRATSATGPEPNVPMPPTVR